MLDGTPNDTAPHPFSSQSLVDRALTTDWPRWRLRLPPHIRVTLPARPPPRGVAYVVAQIALRARRAWIASGRPSVALPGAAEIAQSERDYVLLLRMEDRSIVGPETASRDKCFDQTTTQLEAAPDSPKPTWFGAVPAELITGWLRLGDPLPAQAVGWGKGARKSRFPRWWGITRHGGGHGDRHDDDFSRFDFAWLIKELGKLGNDGQAKTAVEAVFFAVESITAASATARRAALLTARDCFAVLGLPGSELALWLRGRLTAAARGGRGRHTVMGAVDLVLDPARRAELAAALRADGFGQLAARVLREQPNPFSIGRDPERGFYYRFNVIGAHGSTEGRGVRTSVFRFWEQET